jgi:hypothetical protein
LLKKFKIVENQRIEKIGKNLRRGWKKKKKKAFRAFASRAKNSGRRKTRTKGLRSMIARSQLRNLTT